MASFLGVLKKIGSVAIGVEHIAAPILSIVQPQFSPAIASFDRVLTSLQGSIITQEAVTPQDHAGPQKSAAVKYEFENEILGITQTLLALDGKHMQYDAQVLQRFLSAQVLAYNEFSELKRSFKIVSIAPATTANPPSS